MPSTAKVARSSPRRIKGTPERARTRSGQLTKIDLAGGSPDRAALTKTEHPIPGLEPYKHVCPGCCQRVAWRPLLREEIATLFRLLANHARSYISDAMDGSLDPVRALSAIDQLEEKSIGCALGICPDCRFKLCSTGQLTRPDTLDIEKRIERLEYGVASVEARS